MEEKQLSIQERIEVLVRARYPLINIVSSEEQRVEDTLKAIARNRGKRFFIWSVTKGLQSDDGSCATDLREPIKALDHILEGDVNGIFLLKDFHPFLNDPVVVRKVRDIARELKTTMKNVVLLSPVLKVPMDVEKEVTIVDFDLPGKETLGRIIDDITATLADKERVWESGVTREKVVEAALGLTAEEAENVFAKSLVQTGGFTIPIILTEKEQIIRKSGVLEYYRAHEDMAEVGGLENLKLWLNKRSQAFTREAREFGLPEPKGILMIGIPGCGKSLTAKAVSSCGNCPFYAWTWARCSPAWSVPARKMCARLSKRRNPSPLPSSGWTSWKRDFPAWDPPAIRTGEHRPVSSEPFSPGCRRRPAPFSWWPLPITFHSCPRNY